MAEKKGNLATPIILSSGVAIAGVGLYLYMRKPKGADPGDTITTLFAFNYFGEGGDYILQVNFGHIRVITPFFDHVEGLTWELEISLPVPEELPARWEFGVLCPLPEATSSGTYDVEATIRKPGMDKRDYLNGAKVVVKNFINVRKLE